MSLPKRSDIASRPGVLGAHLALLVVQIAFAAGAVEGKLALAPPSQGGAGVDPIALAMARMVGGAIAFQVLARAALRLRPASWADHGRMVGLAVLGVVLNQTLFLVGLRTTSAFAASILGATIPIFAAAFAAMLGIERASLRTGVGIALAIAGVLWLTGFGGLDVGAISIAANCLVYALYIVLSKPVIDKLGPSTVVAWLFTWGALVMSPLGAIPLLRGMARWNGFAWIMVGFFVAIPTVVAYLFNAWAIARVSPTLVTVYIYLQPIIAALLQWVQLGERISSRALGSSVLIVAGVAVVASRRAVTAPAPA